MADAGKLYTRLTRNAAGVGSYSSLWLGTDHLMLVRSTGYNENYSRIQLRDIKAIILTRSERRMLWALFWGIVAVWGGLAAVSSLIARFEESIGSSRASGTTSGTASRTTCWQNEWLSGVCRRPAHGSGSPTAPGKNCRSAETSETSATGTSSRSLTS